MAVEFACGKNLCMHSSLHLTSHASSPLYFCLLCLLYRCPEVNICTPEACPIKDGVAFSGGSTLSCDDGRCSTLNGCEWSDGSATSNYLYWTNLNGNVTLPDCVGITCTGCVISDTAGTNETEPVAEEDTTSTGAFTAMSAFIRVSGIALAVGLFL